jgi:hypothetical protein
VQDVYDSLSLKAAEKNIKCSIKKSSELPITVYADKEKIRMVLINLVSNAIKYGKQNGSIVFSVYKTHSNLVLAEISDDGFGIAEEHLTRIFERFVKKVAAVSVFPFANILLKHMAKPCMYAAGSMLAAHLVLPSMAVAIAKNKSTAKKDRSEESER